MPRYKVTWLERHEEYLDAKDEDEARDNADVHWDMTSFADFCDMEVVEIPPPGPNDGLHHRSA